PLLADQDEGLLVGTLDKALLAQARTVNDYFVDRRPELYASLTRARH
ncbi:hydrolase, partial [Pseudomonas syringae pv. actinidiae ICMP 19070]